ESLAASPNGTLLAIGSQDGSCRVWDLTTGKELLCFRGHTDGCSACAFSHGSEAIVTGDQAGVLRVWTVDMGTLLRQLKAHNTGVSAIACCANVNLFASAGDQESL